MKAILLLILACPAIAEAFFDSALNQLPIEIKIDKSETLEQRAGKPVAIRGRRTFRVEAGPSHQSLNNIVAIYIGLPIPDAGQDQVTIEEIACQKANPENILFSPDRHTLLVEYFDVPPGFQDTITLSFRMDLYCRQTK